jgi:hypothetical protein
MPVLKGDKLNDPASVNYISVKVTLNVRIKKIFLAGCEAVRQFF